MVAELLDPVDYQEENEKIAGKMYNSGKFKAGMFDWKAWSLGLGRYAGEFWVGSHPDLKPCDLSKTAQVTPWGKSRNNPPSDFLFATGPRHRIDEPRNMMDAEKFQKVMHRPRMKSMEYCLLPGLLVRWYALYNKFPAPDSWAWRYFPDGEYWLHQIQGRSWMKEFEKIQNQSAIVPAWEESEMDLTFVEEWTTAIEERLEVLKRVQKKIGEDGQ